MFQTGRMKTKYRWTSLNWVWHMTNRLLAMGLPPGAGGVVVTAAAPPDSSKRTKNTGRYFTSGARTYNKTI